MTTYFVSSIIGSNKDAGTSETAPLASLQAAAALVKPGDTVEVMNGTYTGGAYGDVLDITTSGTASAPITFEAAPGATPVIDSSGCWNAIKVMASYIVINGFTVVGDAANYTVAQAMAGYSTGNASLDGNGIAIVPGGSTTLPNHVTIENNTVYNEPGGGIFTEGSDYVQVLNNVVYNNAHWSAYGNSGISISTSANLNANAGAHIIVSGNTVYGNAQEVPTTGTSVITDGEGIILDTNPNYTSEILVSNNSIYGNGGPGVEANRTNGAVITGNTIYGNNTENVQSSSDSEIFIYLSNNVTVSSNTLSATVTVAYYLANQSTLDATGNITISDTAADVSSAIDTVNADSHVSAITLLGTPMLGLNVAQALDDIPALNAITNSNYGIVVTDTGTNVAANFDALNADTHITSILPTGGSQNIVLTMAQMTNDRRAISLLDPFTIMVTDTASGLSALSTAQIATFSADGVTRLDATDADLVPPAAQRKALARGGISLVEPYLGGTTKVVTYAATGVRSTTLFQGIVGQRYTSFTITYGSNGKAESALYSNGMTGIWTYKADGSYSRVWSGITGTTYTWRKAMHNSAGVLIGTANNLTAGTAGVLIMSTSGARVSSGAGAVNVTFEADTFWLDPHLNTLETVNVTGFGSETFRLSPGFGAEAIRGFTAGGSASDVLSLQLSMFDGLSDSNTAARNEAILLSSHAIAQSGANVTITDTSGDVLTLLGMTTTTLSQNAGSVFKFS